MAGTQRRLRQLIPGLLLAWVGIAPSLATAALAPDAAVSALALASWSDLTDNQKQILAPLEKVWDQLEPIHKIKWLRVTDRYPSLRPAEQERLQKQMLDWARLSPEERKQVREKFMNLKQAAPDKKEVIKQKWKEYEELSDEEKQQLKEKAEKAAASKLAKSAPVTRPIKPLSQPPALKLVPTAKAVVFTPGEDWPNVIPGPVPKAGSALFPLPSSKNLPQGK
ncbi:DUF3106 domain-containing protein [Denitratisoma sp. agr-D3]